jgi:hypothetical protein
MDPLSASGRSGTTPAAPPSESQLGSPQAGPKGRTLHRVILVEPRRARRGGPGVLPEAGQAEV